MGNNSNFPFVGKTKKSKPLGNKPMKRAALKRAQSSPNLPFAPKKQQGGKVKPCLGCGGRLK